MSATMHLGDLIWIARSLGHGLGLDSREGAPIRAVVLVLVNVGLLFLALIGFWHGLLLISAPSLGMAWNGLGMIGAGGVAIWLLIRQVKRENSPRPKTSRPGP